MNRNFLLAILVNVFFSCQKQDVPSPSQSTIDHMKFVDKEWLLGGKQSPQLLAINFRSNDTAIMTKCTWTIPPYTYQTQKWPWHSLGTDSIDLAGFHFRIYSLNDSVLITSNWVLGGVSDTIHQTFKIK